MGTVDYHALCQEIFGTDDEAKIRLMANAWKKRSTRNAGRKKALTPEDISTIEEMAGRGIKIQEIADHFNTTRHCISKYLNDRPGKEYTLRIDYKLGARICTVIYVDFGQENIVIQNRTNDTLYKAFGNNENPTWQDFEQFLSSRCFPKSRGYAKQILQNLGVGSYDPLDIAEATAGRTAEDNLYLTFRSYPRGDAPYANN